MPDVAGSQPSEAFKYRAFISYSHKDKWGEWLHKALERYAVPKRLHGMHGRDGPLGGRIFPVFRDRDELPSSSDLSDQIQKALRESACLIVVCSPNAAQSRWVNEEILAFKRLGRADRILALIVDGEPNSSERGATALECFPEALRFRVGPDGQPTQERVEPVAADLRAEGDGQENAKLKIIAGVLGIGYDTLKQRDLEAQRQRLRRLVGVAATVAVSLAGLAGLAVYFGLQAQDQRAQALRHLADSYAARAQQFANAEDYDLAARLAVHAQSVGAGLSPLADDVLRLAAPRIALRARFPVNVRPRAALGVSPDDLWAVSTQGNDAVIANLVDGTPARVLSGHTRMVQTAAFSSDGQSVVTASDDGTARLWNAATGRPLAVLDGHDAPVWHAQFWREGALVLTASLDGQILVWDTKTKAQVAKLDVRGLLSSLIEDASDPSGANAVKIGGGIRLLAASADGRKILAVSRMFTTHLFVFDDEGNIAARPVNFYSCQEVRFAPDSRAFLAASFLGGLTLFDAEQGTPMRSFDGQKSPIWSAEFSRDGRLLATAAEDGTTRIWDVATAKLLHTIEGPAGSTARMAVFSRDASLLAIGYLDGTIEVWSPSKKELERTLHGHVAAISSLAFADNDANLRSTSWDGTARIWALSESGPKPVLKVSVDEGAKVATSPNYVLITSGQRLTAFHTPDATKRELAFDLPVYAMAASPRDDRVVLATPQGAIVRDLESDRSVTFARDGSDTPVSVGWLPDGLRTFTINARSEVSIWETTNGERRGRIKHADKAQIAAVDFSPDGSRLFARDQSGALDAWDIDGKHLFRLGGGSDGYRSIAVSPASDDIITGGYRAELTLYDARSGKRARELPGHAQGILGGDVIDVQISDDGNYALSAGLDETVRLWSLKSGHELRSYRIPSGKSFGCVGFLPGSHEIVKAEESGDAEIIGIATGQLVLRLPLSGGEGCPVFSRDRKFAVMRGEKDVTLWSTGLLTTGADELKQVACGHRGGIVLSARTFTAAEADSDALIHDIRNDERGDPVDVCGGAVRPRGTAHTAPPDADVVRFARPKQSLAASVTAWTEAFQEGDKLASSGNFTAALKPFGRAVQIARDIAHSYGRTGEARHRLFVSLMMTGGAAVDAQRRDEAIVYLTEAKALLATGRRLGDGIENAKKLEEQIDDAIASLGG